MKLVSRRTLRKIIEESDIVLEIIDVRDPVSTRIRRVERMVKKLSKRIILVLNKCDLVPKGVAMGWKEILKSEGFEVVFLTAKKREGIKILKDSIIRIALNLSKPVKIAVIGVPKVGKSTIINALKKSHSAPTSPYPGSPGYTKGIQLLKIEDGIYLLDTPGIAPVECKDIDALIRSRPVEKLANPVKAALDLMEKIKRYHPEAFREAYGIDEEDLGKILEKLAIKRGWFYKKDKEPLVEEAARTIIRDYFSGKIPFYIPPNK